MFACEGELVFESLHAIDAFTKRKSVIKQRDEGYKPNPIIQFELAICIQIVWIRILRIWYSELPIPTIHTHVKELCP